MFKSFCGSIFFAQFLLSILAAASGLLLFLKPKKCIDIQIAFYRMINWKMEPISMDKEIRNTRVMGALVFVCGVIGFIWAILQL